MEKASSIIIASADHLSGEQIAAAMEDIQALGAWSAQAVHSIAKKRRPGVLLFIEPGEAEEKISGYLARELKIGGYQRLSTAHVFHPVRFTDKRFILRAEGREAAFDLRVKSVGLAESPFYHTVEADDALRICKELEERHGVIRPFCLVKGALDASAGGDEGEIVVTL